MRQLTCFYTDTRVHEKRSMYVYSDVYCVVIEDLICFLISIVDENISRKNSSIPFITIMTRELMNITECSNTSYR